MVAFALGRTTIYHFVRSKMLQARCERAGAHMPQDECQVEIHSTLHRQSKHWSMRFVFVMGCNWHAQH